MELDFAVAAAGAEPGDEADVAGEHDGGENGDAAEGGLVVGGADVFDFGLFGRGKGGDFCFVEGTIGEAVFGLGGFGDFLVEGWILAGEVFVQLIVLKRAEKWIAEDADGDQTDSADGAEGEGAAFGELFGNDAERGRPEKCFAEAVTGGGEEDDHRSGAGVGEPG